MSQHTQVHHPQKTLLTHQNNSHPTHASKKATVGCTHHEQSPQKRGHNSHTRGARVEQSGLTCQDAESHTNYNLHHPMTSHVQLPNKQIMHTT